MCGLKWHNAFHMHRGNLEKLGVSAWHEKNEKMANGCERNFKGRFSEELPWRVVQQFISEDDP